MPIERRSRLTCVEKAVLLRFASCKEAFPPAPIKTGNQGRTGRAGISSPDSLHSSRTRQPLLLAAQLGFELPQLAVDLAFLTTAGPVPGRAASGADRLDLLRGRGRVVGCGRAAQR